MCEFPRMHVCNDIHCQKNREEAPEKPANPFPFYHQVQNTEEYLVRTANTLSFNDDLLYTIMQIIHSHQRLTSAH